MKTQRRLSTTTRARTLALLPALLVPLGLAACCPSLSPPRRARGVPPVRTHQGGLHDLIADLGEREAGVRRAAVAALAKLDRRRNPRAREALLGATRDESPVVRRAAFRGIAGWKNRAAALVLMSALPHQAAATRGLILRQLATLPLATLDGLDQALPAVLAAYGSPDGALRKAAGRVLLGVGASAVYDLLKMARKAARSKTTTSRENARTLRCTHRACRLVLAMGKRAHTIVLEQLYASPEIEDSGFDVRPVIWARWRIFLREMVIRSGNGTHGAGRMITAIILGIGRPVLPALLRLAGPTGGEARSSALTLLGHRCTPKAVPVLLTALKDPRAVFRQVAAAALTGCPGPRARRVVEGLLAQGPKDLRLAVVQAIGTYRAVDKIALLARALRSSDDDLQRAAIQSAEDNGSAGRAVVPDLIRLLKSKEYHLRTSARDALGRIGDRRAVPALIAELQKHKSSSKRRSVVESLSRIRDPRVLATLIGMVPKEGSWVLEAVAEGLGRQGDAKAIGPLVKLADRGLRDAYYSLGKLRDPRAIAPLVVRVKRGKYFAAVGLGMLKLRAATKGLVQLARQGHKVAVEGLIGLGAKAAGPLLLGLLKEASPKVPRIEVVKAIRKLKLRRAVPELLRLLPKANRRLKGVIAKTLGKLGDKRALKPLGRLALQGYGDAIDALAKLGDPSAIPVLQQVLSRWRHKNVRAHAKYALGELLNSQP